MPIMTREQILRLADRVEAHAQRLPRTSERRDVTLLVRTVRAIVREPGAVDVPDDLPEPSRASHSSP